MLYSYLVPALFLNATAYLPISIGEIATGSDLFYADVITGSLASEPNFHPSIKGSAIRGGDWLTVDPSGNVTRLNINILIKTDDEPPSYIRLTGNGPEIGTKEVLDIITGVPNAKPVKYGDFQATSAWSISAGNNQYYDLQNRLFIGSTSLRAGPLNGTFIVGFKLAQVFSTATDENV